MDLRVCLASQTPPVRFRAAAPELVERYPDLTEPFSIHDLVEGEDFEWTSGGVPVMLRQLLATAQGRKLWRASGWVALNPTAPREFLLDGTPIRSVTLETPTLAAYAACKEKMWAEIHRMPRAPITPTEFAGFTAYNWRTSREILEMLPDCDVAFVHDFQLLQTGGMIGLSGPAVLRWHIPFEPHRWSRYFRNFVVRAVEGFDAVIVSCRRDLEGLVQSGYRGIARQVYPYLDPETAKPASPAARDELAFRLRIPDDAPVALCVSRMDPIKGQDRLIRAFAAAHRKMPEARLVLVGNGSFTSSKRAGLGVDKGSRWRAKLEQDARELGVADAVRFTGYLPPELLDAAWERADVVVQPSAIEGFALTAVEGWLRDRPAIVSRGAGVSELVIQGVNGYVYDPDDVEGLATHLLHVFANPDEAARLGRRGREEAKRCDLVEGAKAESRVLEEAVASFRRG
ncbi:MAG TPA: glycosyltransferase family 4 protein [Candidatus Thermoplasmatota archaeon]|nr:glycosyltransferase family 4 protein [Candidatus Thermoplasmatota archaeon]